MKASREKKQSTKVKKNQNTEPEKVKSQAMEAQEENISENKEKSAKRWIFIAVILLLQALLCVGCMEWVSRGSFIAVLAWVKAEPLYLLYNITVVLWLICFFDVIFHDLRWGYVILQVISAVFGVAESMKLEARKEYIEFSDIMIAGEWTQAASDVKFQGVHVLIGTAAFMVFFVLCLWLCKGFWKRKRTKKAFKRGSAVWLLSGLLFAGAVYYPAVSNGLPKRVVIGAEGEKKGGTVCFLESIAYYSMTTDYSDEIYAEALAYFGLEEQEAQEAPTDAPVLATIQSAQDITVKPNIVVIMSEALWDINQIAEAVTFTKDPMADFDMADAHGNTYIKGKAASNVFGGGTDKSEFEFLTGWNSKYALSGSSPYRDFFTRGQASIVQYLKELGYLSYAIHPYKGDFWGRDTSYKNMGFDDFYSMTVMKHQDKYDVFISDAALTDEIIDRFEERRRSSDAPVFSFNVSIQNHVTRIAEGEAAPTCHDVALDYHIDYTELEAYTRNKLLGYVNGVYTSGKEWQRLIDYFAGQKEPTVILLFGDHAPSFLSDFEDHVSREIADKEFYETPFYIWNNYGLGEFGEDEINISYLSELLLEYIGFPLTKQGVLNKYLRLKCPVDTRFLVRDADGKPVDITEDAYIDRSYGVSNAMHYALTQNSYEMDIWRILP